MAVPVWRVVHTPVIYADPGKMVRGTALRRARANAARGAFIQATGWYMVPLGRTSRRGRCRRTLRRSASPVGLVRSATRSTSNEGGSRPTRLPPARVAVADVSFPSGDRALRIVKGRFAGRDLVSPNDSRVQGTVHAVERELLQNGLVMRYLTEGQDGLPPREGAFLACSFWLADNYILQGRQEEGRALFERLLGLCNDVGLLAEEYDPLAGRMVGNFPQAFSHVALVNTALNLSRMEGPAEHRSH